jgi:tetratricopeptide (TPR) repeat protein
MAPEQHIRADVTPAADLYAVGLVLYESVTGQRWRWTGDAAEGPWDGVPARLARVLRVALAREPEQRWPDAKRFADALRRAAAGRRQMLTVVTTAILAAVGIGAVALSVVRGSPKPGRTDIAVLPFAVDGAYTDLGAGLARATELHLEVAWGDTGLLVTPSQSTGPWWSRRADTVIDAAAWSHLRTTHIVRGAAVTRDDSLEVSVVLLQPDDEPRLLTRFIASADDQLGMGFSVARAVAAAIRPRLAARFVGARSLTGGSAAAQALISGDLAFQRDNWPAAEQFYSLATTLDPNLARAWWGLYNVQRWRRQRPDVDLAAVYAAHGAQMGGPDALLIQADLAPTVPARLRIYERAVAAYPWDAYAWLLFGNELYHRGALAGARPDRAILALDSAATINPDLAPTFSMLAWAWIRRGNAAAARAALDRYAAAASPLAEQDFCLACVLDLAWQMRFAPDRAMPLLRELIATPDGPGSLARVVRLGLSFGVPEAQLEIARLLGATSDPAVRRHALVARAPVLVALGKVAAALASLDEAAALPGGEELVLVAAQWRVLLPVLRVPGVPESARDTGRAVLGRYGTGAWSTRVHWTLALDAISRGDVATGDQHVRVLDSLDAGGDLHALAAGWLAAARGDTTGALQLTDSLPLRVLAAQVRDPLQRAVLFLGRGWWLGGRDLVGADAAWGWYENTDLASGWATGSPHPAEVDWALETYARFLRAELAHRAGDESAVCALAPEAAARWRGADSAYGPIQRLVASWATACGA